VRLRYFLIGLLVGLAIAPGDRQTTWRMFRDGLARTIDAALRLGSDRSQSGTRAL
jgi:hypothetical protein